MKYVSFSIFLILVCCSSKVIFACSCLPEASPNYNYWNADAIFTGKVEEIQDISSSDRKVHFEIIDSYRGIKDTKDIFVKQMRSFCGVDSFDKGKKYLIYVNKTEAGNVFANPICPYVVGFTDNLVGKEADFFQLLKNNKPDYNIEGMIWSESEFVARNIEITIEKSGRIYRQQLEKNSGVLDFSIPVDEAGTYIVKVSLPQIAEKGHVVTKSRYHFQSNLKSKTINKKTHQIEMIYEVNVEADKFPFFDVPIVDF